MKLVLSRKGFDSSYGGMPSPILPDGTLVPLPIPSRHDVNTLAEINFPEVDVAKLVCDLSRGKHDKTTTIHLDPDLDRPYCNRLHGWRPALGQTGAAQSHLAQCGVGPGDVFVFFGWFRLAELHDGAWHFVRGAPHLHVMFGWLEVDAVLPVVTGRGESIRQHPWIANHPHVANPAWYDNPLNSLYIARCRSTFAATHTFGAGRFPKFKPALQLTAAGKSRSVWSLPNWFFPDGRPALTYHAAPERWTRTGGTTTLNSVAKGQEFVLDGSHYPELAPWISHLIKEGCR